MRIDLISAAPEIFESVLSNSIIKIAQEKGLVRIETHNLHDYADDRFRHIDDYVFGGGAGMLIKCEPVFKCVESLQSERQYDEIIFMTVDGEKLDQQISNRLSLCENIIIIAGRYKGVDQRIRDALVTMEISIGDYVLSGGELPALVAVDSIVRLLPGALGDAESALDDSLQTSADGLGLLEAPQYTRPAEFRGMKVPEILLSGDHKKIQQWRREKAFEKTRERRPDLLE